MHYNTDSSLSSSTRPSACFTVQITWPTILKSPNPSRTSLVRVLLYKLNQIHDRQHPCLTPLPIFTRLVSSWANHTLTFWSTYNFLINILLHKSLHIHSRICINLDQLTCSNAFCQPMKEAHISSSMFKVRFWDYSQHPNYISSFSSSSISKFIICKYILNILFNSSSNYPCYYLCWMNNEAIPLLTSCF